MNPPTFVIDQGNTTTKAGLFVDGKLVDHLRVEKGQEQHLLDWIKESGSRGGIVSSVRKDKGQALLDQLGSEAVRMHQEIPLPFGNDYRTPKTLGVDRLANCAGALRLMPTNTLLIVDCGSCLTATYIENGRLQGGSISPGLRMRFEALAAFTGQLPHLAPSDQSIERIGKSTEESILSGVQCGVLAEIEEIIAHYCSINKALSVIITGGDASYFVPRLKSPIFAEPFLTLMGLHEIYQFRLHHP